MFNFRPYMYVYITYRMEVFLLGNLTAAQTLTYIGNCEIHKVWQFSGQKKRFLKQTLERGQYLGGVFFHLTYCYQRDDSRNVSA